MPNPYLIASKMQKLKDVKTITKKGHFAATVTAIFHPTLENNTDTFIMKLKALILHWRKHYLF